MCVCSFSGDSHVWVRDASRSGGSDSSRPSEAGELLPGCSQLSPPHQTRVRLDRPARLRSCGTYTHIYTLHINIYTFLLIHIIIHTYSVYTQQDLCVEFVIVVCVWCSMNVQERLQRETLTESFLLNQVTSIVFNKTLLTASLWTVSHYSALVFSDNNLFSSFVISDKEAKSKTGSIKIIG